MFTVYWQISQNQFHNFVFICYQLIIKYVFPNFMLYILYSLYSTTDALLFDKFDILRFYFHLVLNLEPWPQEVAVNS